MLRLGWRACRLAVAAAAVIALAPGTASAHHHKLHADLTVSKGTVSAADGQLTGSFDVHNKGKAKAKRSKASLAVVADGQNHEANRFKMGSLRTSTSRTMTVAAAVPTGLPVGSWPIQVCADVLHTVKERSEKNNCRQVGTIIVAAPVSSVPTDPIPFTKNTPFTLTDPQSNYWVDVPNAYDETHATPMTLFVWLHGCFGLSSGEIYTVSPGGNLQDWISVAVGGREGDCWDPNTDAAKVLAAIADVKTHFNINPRSVILGGYSSGGDLTYRTAFYNSSSFAGILIENSSPFKDTGSTQSASLAAATTKFHIVHLAHIQDVTYPIAGVETETDAVTSAGFPLIRVERDGTHYDNAGDIVNSNPVPGTTADLSTYLLSHIDDGWLSPP